MQQFIAKYEKDIQGVMSGFDRVLFRGSLRRLTHSLGMKWYLSENNILCKQYEDHVKAISQKIKKAAVEPFQRQNLLVKHVFGRDDKEKIARAFAAEKGLTEGDVCAQRHGDGSHFSALQDGHGDPAAPLPDDLPLPHRSGIWLDACANSDLVPLLHSRLHQWPGMAEPPHGPGRTTLFPPGELFPPGSRTFRGHNSFFRNNPR